MITNDKAYHEGNKLSLFGLSTDTKPTEEYDGKPIENASTFFEMDTKTVKFYDADSDTWV